MYMFFEKDVHVFGKRCTCFGENIYIFWRRYANELASIYGKEVGRFLSDMANAKGGGLNDALRYVDKKKALDWLGMAPPKGAPSLTKQELSIAKVINNFNNPNIWGEINKTRLFFTGKVGAHNYDSPALIFEFGGMSPLIQAEKTPQPALGCGVLGLVCSNEAAFYGLRT